MLGLLIISWGVMKDLTCKILGSNTFSFLFATDFFYSDIAHQHSRNLFQAVYQQLYSDILFFLLNFCMIHIPHIIGSFGHTLSVYLVRNER